MNRAFLPAILLGMLAACGDPTFVVPGSPDPVVRAFLYAGQPVNDVRLTWTVPINTSDTANVQVAPPINDATVVLVRNGVRYPLVKSAGDSGYYQYNGTGLIVREGDVY